EDLPLGLRRTGIEGGLELVDQRGELDEAATHMVALDELHEHRHGEVGLADAGRPDEEEARLAEADPLLHELLDVALSRAAGLVELLVDAGMAAGDVEVGQPAVPVSGG